MQPPEKENRLLFRVESFHNGKVTMNVLNYQKTKRACYFTNLVMASAFSLPPLLFATFREMYGISYTLLGTLVLINFCTQLGIDLLFSFFSHLFNVQKTLRIMPLITALGLCIYALIPMCFPQYAYAGLVIGTVIFSVAAGLDEVLMSSAMAAIPGSTDADMSILHALYGYGLIVVVIISTLFLRLVGNTYWMYLTFFWAALPVIAAALLMRSPLPEMNTAQPTATADRSGKRTKGLILCICCIFLGSCAENTMSNWISAYAENALQIPKVWGDLLGMMLFAGLLALTRSAYAKFGKNIMTVLMLSMSCSVVCYLAAAFSPSAAVSLIACVALGICTSMLWPGTLILMEEKIPSVGVAAYALMAAGGDLGAAFSPQAFGIIVDQVSVVAWAQSLGTSIGLTPEQVGFRTALLIVAAFPALGLLLLTYMKKFFK